MHKLRNTIDRPRQNTPNAEDRIDEQLARGEVLDAATVLDTGENYGPTEFPHHYFKACALPFYELAYHPPTEERIRNANDTYTLVGELIRRELIIYNSDDLCPTTPDKYQHLGRISELTIFELLARGRINMDPHG